MTRSASRNAIMLIRGTMGLSMASSAMLTRTCSPRALTVPQKVTTELPFRCGRDETFRISARLIFLETHKVMNWTKLILLSCVVLCVFAVSTATAQTMGHRASTVRMPMHRAPMLGPTVRMPMQRAAMPGPTGRTPMHRDPMLTSTSSFHRFNDGDFDRDDGFRRFDRFNDIIVFDNFGFPFFPFSPFFPLFFQFFPPVFLF